MHYSEYEGLQGHQWAWEFLRRHPRYRVLHAGEGDPDLLDDDLKGFGLKIPVDPETPGRAIADPHDIWTDDAIYAGIEVADAPAPCLPGSVILRIDTTQDRESLMEQFRLYLDDYGVKTVKVPWSAFPAYIAAWDDRAPGLPFEDDGAARANTNRLKEARYWIAEGYLKLLTKTRTFN